MSRSQIAFASTDISALARSLRAQLAALGETPSHVQMLNMLAKAAGYRNFQHLRAGAAEAPPAATGIASWASATPEPVNEQRVVRALNHFGPDGRLLSWPARTSQQELCVWALWARYPARNVTDERGISAWLDAHHDFGDAALLRRTMVNLGLVTRTQDGRDYRRVERTPPPELGLLLARLGARKDGLKEIS